LAEWRIFSKDSIEELHLNLPKNCHTKHCTRLYAKPLLCVLCSVFVCLTIVVPMCVGLVALLQFLAWFFAFGKTANVLPNALAIHRF
jgi:hypothetical protein